LPSHGCSLKAMTLFLFPAQRRSRFDRHVVRNVFHVRTKVDFVLQYLEENLNAAEIQLTPADLDEVRAEAKKADTSNGGERYPPGMEELLFADTPELR